MEVTPFLRVPNLNPEEFRNVVTFWYTACCLNITIDAKKIVSLRQIFDNFQKIVTLKGVTLKHQAL